MPSTSTTTASRVRLQAQNAGVGDSGAVTVIQLWAGFPRDRSAIVTVVDGKAHTGRVGSLRRMQAVFDTMSPAPGAAVLDDGTARRLLADRGITDRQCTCTALLPIGAMWCTGCGAAHGARR